MLNKLLNFFGLNKFVDTTDTIELSPNAMRLYRGDIAYPIDKIEVEVGVENQIENEIWYIYIDEIEESPFPFDFKDLEFACTNSAELISHLRENYSIDKAKLYAIMSGNENICLLMRTINSSKKASIYAVPRYFNK